MIINSYKYSTLNLLQSLNQNIYYYNLKHYLVSSKSGDGIDNLFEQISCDFVLDQVGTMSQMIVCGSYINEKIWFMIHVNFKYTIFRLFYHKRLICSNHYMYSEWYYSIKIHRPPPRIQIIPNIIKLCFKFTISPLKCNVVGLFKHFR